MAIRRMFSKEITTSDVFVDMPISCQLLYFHLGMEADDDGFLGNARMLSRAYGMNTDDLRLLEAKGLVISFDNGVTVIKDWQINNQIRKDRHKPTIYKEEQATLLLDEKGSYTLKDNMATNRQPSDNQVGAEVATQYRLGKGSIGKDRLGKSSSREEGIKKIYHYYESNGFGTLAQKTMQDFDYWIKDLMKIGATEGNAIEIIIHSLGIAVDRNKRNYGYANAILKDWEQKGFTKVSDILANDKKNTVTEPKMPDYSLPDEFKNQFDNIKEPDFEMPY